MKNIRKAIRLYLKISINPWLLSFGVLMLACVLAFIITVDPQLENETPKGFLPVLITMTFTLKLFGIGVIQFPGILSLAGNKVFASLPFAKELYMKVHLFASIGMTLIFDLMIIGFASLRWAESDFVNLLIILPASSIPVFTVFSTLGKQKISILALIGYLLFMIVTITPSTVLNKLSFGVDLSVGIAAVIGTLIYIVGIVITVLLNRFWWKHCNHVNARKTVIVR